MFISYFIFYQITNHYSIGKLIYLQYDNTIKLFTKYEYNSIKNSLQITLNSISFCEYPHNINTLIGIVVFFTAQSSQQK